MFVSDEEMRLNAEPQEPQSIEEANALFEKEQVQEPQSIEEANARLDSQASEPTQEPQSIEEANALLSTERPQEPQQPQEPQSIEAANAEIATVQGQADFAKATAEDAANGEEKPSMGWGETAAKNFEAQTGFEAAGEVNPNIKSPVDKFVLNTLSNMQTGVAKSFAAGQMLAAQGLSDGQADRPDGTTDRLLARMIYGTVGGTVASWFSTPDVLEEWDNGEGKKYKDPAERTRARNAFAAEIARQFILDRTQSQTNAALELQNREKSFGADAYADTMQSLGYQAWYRNPVGIAAQFLISGWGNAENLASDQYAFDEDGNLTITANGDSTGAAIAKGFTRAGIETGVEVVGGKLAGKFMSSVVKGLGGKVLKMAVGKFPIATEVAGRIAATKVGQAVANVTAKLNKFASWTSKKLHLEGLPEEYFEEWLDPTLAEAFGVERRGSEQQGTSAAGRVWEAQKEFFTAENQQRLVTSLILLQGAGQFAAWMDSRHQMKVVDNYLKKNGLMTDEQIASATTEEKAAAMDAHVKGMDEGEVKDTLDKTAETADAAAKSMERETAEKEAGADPAATDAAAQKERREKVSKVRGAANVSDQVQGVEDLGITDWKQAEEEGLVERDAFGRLEGKARRALTISLNATDNLKAAVKSGQIDGELAEDMITAAQCELGGKPKDVRNAFIDGILERANGDAALARQMVDRLAAQERTDGDERTVDETLDEIAAHVKAESIAQRNGVSVEEGKEAAQTAVETADGEMTTLGAVVDAEGTETRATPRKPETALDGVEQANRLQGTRLRATGDNLLTCETFKSLQVRVDEGGVWVSGLSADMLQNPDNAADAAAVISQLARIAQGNGLRINFADKDSADMAAALAREVNRQGLERTQKKLDLRASLLDVLLKTELSANVTTDEKSFADALAQTSNGSQWKDSHDNIYGFVDRDGNLHLNPRVLDFDTPIHEYGHLALEAVRKVNKTLWQRGMDLIRESEYFAAVKKASQTEGHEYQYLNGRDDAIADEALATMIGDRGAKLVESRGVDAKLKAWIKEVWSAFKSAFGIADLTEEQIETMTLDQFVDVVNAELLKGSEFGARKRAPSQSSVKAYDESSGDSNGLYRWANERGCLFQLPVDMERTQPGGKVYFLNDDANVTDWIQSALNGVDLRMSQSGKIYVKGQNGLSGDLAVIFGRYPQIGRNDGVFSAAAGETGRADYAAITDPQQLVDALLADRDNYQSWKKNGGVDSDVRAAEERAEWEKKQAEDAARVRWEDSGMSVVDYVKSRVEEGDPAFDLDWETAKEIERMREQDALAESDVVPYEGEVPFSVRRNGEARMMINPKLREETARAMNTDRKKGEVVRSRAIVELSDTPAVLQELGMPNARIITNATILRKVEREHQISADEFAEIPDAYADPVAMFRDGKNYVVLTSKMGKTKHSGHKPIMVYLKPDAKRNTFMASAYARENNKEIAYINLAKAGGLVFIDKEKAALVGLEDATWSQLRPLAENGLVKTPKDLSSNVTGRSITYSDREAQGGGEGKFSVGRLYTGSAADYEKPSLHAVGTGEGSQVYGWGLYASNVRGVADGYAARKTFDEEAPGALYYNGEFVNNTALARKDPYIKTVIQAAYGVATGHYTSIEDFFDKRVSLFKKMDLPPKSIEDLQRYYDRYVREKDMWSNRRNEYVYEQTFFTNRAPGDESHLLNWYEMDNLMPGNALHEQVKWIRKQAKKEGVKLPRDLGSYGSDVYETLVGALGSPKAASEFLARADIDGVKYPVGSYGSKGVKDGDKVGWNYVSFRDDNISVDHKWVNGEQKFHVGDGKIIDDGLFVFNPRTEEAFAMGETEQSAAGLAAGIERAEALRPWTAKDSPAAKAGPIAFDAADLVMFWRAVSGSTRNPHVQKGERIKGRKSAVGLNVGGERIEIVSRLFGVLDKGDVAKIREEMKGEGYFQNENPMWNGRRSRLAISREVERSQGELDRRIRELYERRVRTGEGGGHYAAQVLGHEIGHTIAALPRDKPLGPVGDSLKTLFDVMNRAFQKEASPLRKAGDRTVDEETRSLIAWWHGQETMPEYYEKPTERFAELFGIFLTQPKSVAQMAPKTYEKLVQTVAQNEKLARAYQKVTSLKWSGKSTDAFMEKVRETWSAEAQEQYRQLVAKSKESISLKRDWFCYALNDRFGPMFSIAKRGIKAARELLEKAVREGAMSREEADDRIAAQNAEVDSLKTSLYDWQRQSGGSTRLMIAGFEGVKAEAEKDGVDWSDVRDYAHCARVIELGGRATAHGGDPAKANAALDEMRTRIGDEGFAKVQKTWNAFRAVYERSVLEDPNVKELFDAATHKMLMENKHYVTMRHRMGVEETAEWLEKIDEYRRANPDAVDPILDMAGRIHKTIGAPGEGSQGFVLHRLVGSFEATEDPLAATIRRAVEIKESAARNHLLKQMSETLRACKVKGVFDLTDGKPRAADGKVYGKLKYMLDGQAHELIVPAVIFRQFNTDSTGFGKFGEAMRFIRNTMTLWNPAFINRAYLLDKNSLETNIEGLHKPVVDVISEALCFRGIGVPLYLVNNYLARFTPIANTWLGRIIWNEHTVNHYAHRAQKIARIVYEGKFAERLAEAQGLREKGLVADAAEIEQNVEVARDMMKRNVFQSQYEFNREQAGVNTDDILASYGYRLEGGREPTTLRGKAWEKMKAAGRFWNRFEEEQEACTKIIAYLYQMKADEAAGRTGEADAEARARLVIEQGGTPNLAARGVLATYIENATGFFWNVRKEGAMRTIRAAKDHPAEWFSKNLAQTAAPALLKALMLTGGLEAIVRAFFDDDDEKIRESWWAPAVLEHSRWTSEAMKCIPGYYQRNYNMIPLAKFGDEVLSMRVKYSPEEFAIQSMIHVAFQKFGIDPTDPSAGWSELTAGVWNEFFPNIFGRNYLFDTVGTIVGPLIGVNPTDMFRDRKFYDEDTWKARGVNAHTAAEIGKQFWNYSPLGTFTATFKNGQERKLEDSEVPAWLDKVLSTPLVRMIPASMLTVTSKDSYLKGLKEKDDEHRALARIKARDVLAESIKRGSLGGFQEGLKDLPPELQKVAIRYVMNGWKQYHADPKAKQYKQVRAIKDPQLKNRAMKWIEDGNRYQD